MDLYKRVYNVSLSRLYSIGMGYRGRGWLQSARITYSESGVTIEIVANWLAKLFVIVGIPATVLWHGLKVVDITLKEVYSVIKGDPFSKDEVKVGSDFEVKLSKLLGRK